MLDAALAELSAVGYAAFTIDGVARRSGVHKTTIYRRWKDRERLVVDALTDHVAVEVPIPDTGAVATDLREHARALVRWLTSPIGRAVMGATLSDAARVPELADVNRRYFDDRFRRAGPVVAHAIARGELPADTDPAELVKAMIAPIYLRFLVTAEPIDETIADRAAQAALAVARAGLLRASDVRHEG
ncbi:MAG TPA: TetR/AcrR family transcriptional regulator [Mycobacterium sp.]|nr:TetR/AcrR family transcriptional regulator [Mycobacterium sp.]